jgi:galactokinase
MVEDTAVAAFRRAFGDAPDLRVASAPGRVNLVGGHTDYNDGFVLPAAVDRRVAVAFAPAAGRSFTVRAEDVPETATFGPDDLAPGAHGGWMAYVAGTAWALEAAGLELRPLRMALAGEVPMGAGLASSAALEMAVARALVAAEEAEWRPREAAEAGRRAENEYVGVATGLMDQLVSAAARRGRALFLDCRSLERRHLPVPEEAALLVLHTGVRRELAGSAFDDRRAACQRAVEAIRRVDRGVRALRDVDRELLERAAGGLDPEAWKRARHVVAEIRRTREAARALEAGDLEEVGRLMTASHRDLRDLYEVSCPELDRVVASATEQAGCLGARLTGAGFGGCAVALVRREAAEDVAAAVEESYRRRFDRPFRAFACRPGAGARLSEPMG